MPEEKARQLAGYDMGRSEAEIYIQNVFEVPEVVARRAHLVREIESARKRAAKTKHDRVRYMCKKRIAEMERELALPEVKDYVYKTVL